MPGQAGDRELYPDEVVGAVLVKADDGESVGVHLFLHLASPVARSVQGASMTVFSKLQDGGESCAVRRYFVRAQGRSGA
jgi:hypothetical protein